MKTETHSVEQLANREYKYGFVSDIESDSVPPGLDESVVRFISAKKEEPEWLLEWRLRAFRLWQRMSEPKWANVSYPPMQDTPGFETCSTRFGSAHSGVFHMVMCSGSVHAISYSINPQIHLQLAKRNDGIPIPGDAF